MLFSLKRRHNMPTVKMSDDEKADLFLKIFELYREGHLDEAAELAKTVPVEKFVERACGREYLEKHGYNTSELD
jgi:hypothetical protein